MDWWKRLTNRATSFFKPGEKASESGGCDHGDINLREGTADFDWFIARAELEAGKNLAHGLSHLANLLTFDPARPEWNELLETYLAKVGPAPEKLLPQGKEMYYGVGALRAYIHHRAGELEQAIGLLTDVTAAVPAARYVEAWAFDWLNPPGAMEGLSTDAGLRFFAVALNRFPDARQATVRRLKECNRMTDLSERFFSLPRNRTDESTMVRVGLLRRAGRFDEALQISRATFQEIPNWHNAVAIGLICRQQGDALQAEWWFNKGLEIDPTDISARLEAGDSFFEFNQWPQALKWYENALEKDRQQAWALPSAMFCRWKMTGEGRHREDLADLARSARDNNRAQALAWRAYMPELPAPQDASANVLRKICESLTEKGPADPDEKPSTMSLRLNLLEAPSNTTAFRLEMKRLRQNMILNVTVEEIQDPDPRLPLEPVDYLLWKFEGTDPVPAVPPPPQEIVDQIAKIASTPIRDAINWADASRLAEKLGTSRVEELLAVLVHPPDAPEETPALEWLPRVQLTVCQVIAQLDEGWENSIRRKALYSLLLGPSDWTTTAAVYVLSQIGTEEPVYAPDIHAAFQKRVEECPDRGYVCWLYPLYTEWLKLPHLFPKEREELERAIQALESDE